MSNIDDDDDEEDQSFQGYYKITPNQKAFNEEVASMYFGKGATPQNMPSSVVYPKVILICLCFPRFVRGSARVCI